MTKTVKKMVKTKIALIKSNKGIISIKVTV